MPTKSSKMSQKRGDCFRSLLLKILFYRLLEVTLQQTLQTAAVTGLIAGHLVDGIPEATPLAVLPVYFWLHCRRNSSIMQSLSTIFPSSLLHLQKHFEASSIQQIVFFWYI